ncbi:MAG: hypothetical protein E7015_03440 [Alphaproteobacteria bacterium]|nr:hypothetical protein [Alphaproteobacteria bacterium]
MKKSIACLSILGLLVSGCSSKKPLSGKRVDILLHEETEFSNAFQDKEKVIVASFQNNEDFTQPGYNSRHAYDPLSFSLNLKCFWKANLDFESTESIRMLSSAVVANGRVFCLDAGGILYAFDKNSGRTIWKKSTTLKGKDGQVGGSLACSSGKVIATSSFAEALAFDEQNGNLLWRIKLPAPCKGDGITVDNGKAYILCDNSTLHVVDINNGKICWSHSGMHVDTTFSGSSAVAVKDGITYVAYPSGEIFAVLENGMVLWSAIMSKFSFVDAMQSFSHPRASVVVYDNLLYVVNVNKQLIAYDCKTGAIKWKSNVGGFSAPVVSGNSLFVCSDNSEIICFNKNSGARRWVKALPAAKDINNWNGLLLTSEGLLTVSNSGMLILVSVEDGTVKKVLSLDETGNGVSVSPVIADRVLYLPTDKGKLISYR